MADRTTRIILVLIAAGLWANVASSLLRPAAATTTDQDAQFALEWMRRDVNSIGVNVSAIASGLCENRKLCDGPLPQSK